MNLRIQTLVWGSPLMIALAACATAGAVPLGEAFSLAVGESAAIDDQGLGLTFDGVLRDNRCPKDVQCIVAGAATVVLTAEGDGTREELTVDVPPGGSATGHFAGFEITVAKVEPATDTRRPIEPEDYVVTLVVKQP